MDSASGPDKHLREGADRGGLDKAEITFFADLQDLLSAREKPTPKRISRICAVDAYYSRNNVVAVATTVTEGRVVEQSIYKGHYTFPYASGLLYLHEGPFVVEAVRRLKTRPHLLCFDAHGIAHPRSAGLARICGMVLGLPSIGIAKSLLIGEVREDGKVLGRMVHDGRIIGFVTKVGGSARYWSPGHAITVRQLESLIGGWGDACLRAMAESHRASKRESKGL